MKYYYSIRTDTVRDEADNVWTVYGITIADENGAVIKTIPDVFLNKAQVEEFVNLCNKLQLAPVHIMDAIDNALVF